ncbi:sensor domain-containing diguanylate cyclase [Oceanisphaera psychrotolerans]|uniref:diguanylate cyclase n=1 Tax=Oceanisphaera psychrotolerans TaxID=1414654 RepID=A0A1J4QLF7_9GAMM|nr:sensor domain-containing diguanylate cyclase [Oceanisphaera psychrotolerans]OIN14439.1 diguanylate cyclase [Oceanisphaera psychrotolerans]
MNLTQQDPHAFHWLLDMLESVEIGLVVLDLDFQIQLWNGFMENHSGLTAGEVRDRPLFRLFPDLPETWLRRKVDTVVTLKTRTFTSWEQRPYLFRFGTTRPVTGTAPAMYQNLTISPLTDPDGSITRVCLMIYDVTDVACSRLALEQANAQLARLSITDNLTGLLNRGAWENQLDAEFARYRRYGHDCSLVMLDIDNFKSINDHHGHPTGDEVIRHVAASIRSSLRLTDHPGRYGGEEFGIILPETDAEGARIIAERLRQTVEAAVVAPHGSDIRYTISLGIAPLRGGINLSAEWLRLADDALYAAKNSGKNRVVCV